MVSSPAAPVLIVDDNAEFRYLLGKALTARDAEAVPAGSAFEALEIIERRPEIRHAVVDVHLGSGSPTGLTFALMARAKRKDMDVVLISAFSRYQDRAEFNDFGGVLAKTDDVGALAASIRKRFAAGPVEP